MEKPSETPGWEEALRRPDGLVGGTSGPSLAQRLDAWLAEARIEGSADARARERWLHASAEADATFAGVLLDLAERRGPVAIASAGGRRHHGTIEVTGADFVALRLASGAEVLLPLVTVSAVRTVPRADASLGEQAVATELRLVEVLAELAAERTRVLLVPADGAESVAGALRAVGQDVVTVRTDGDPPATAYVPVRSIAEVLLG